MIRPNNASDIRIIATAETDGVTDPDSGVQVDWNNVAVGGTTFVVDGYVNTDTNSIVWEDVDDATISTCLAQGVC